MYSIIDVFSFLMEQFPTAVETAIVSVCFFLSRHRGSSLDGSFNEEHIGAVSQAV